MSSNNLIPNSRILAASNIAPLEENYATTCTKTKSFVNAAADVPTKASMV
jgi:hypothetical protein